MLTSSPKPALVGRQTPRLLRLPDRAGSLGEEALDLWYLTGRRSDPWQELSLDALFSVDAFGLWSCSEFGELVSRQNGKGDILSPAELAHLYLWPKPNGEPKTIVHTAHQFKTAREAFLKLQRAIKASPALMGEIAKISTSHGEEGFELANGNRLLYLARSRNSGVGFTVDVLIVDEAQEMGQEALNALLPTMSAVENTQVIFTGTVPDELNNSEVWEGVRDRGRAGTDPRGGWIEFTPDGSDDPDTAAKIDVMSPEVWRQGNPALGYRPGLATSIGDEAIRMDRASFAIQRLSIWPNRREEEAESLSDLDIEVWKRHARDDAAVAGEGAVIALAVGRGGGFATIGKAVRLDGDSIAVEHHKTDRGTLWVADELKTLKAELGNALVVLDPKNATAVIGKLEAAKIKFLSMNLDEIAAAHSLFVELVNAGMVPHRNQPEVTKSLELATTRPIGRSGFTWEPSDPTKPITQAQAVTWALWGVLKSEATPKRERPIVKGYA
ncbi:hypothetical protein PFZ55_48990 [Streptomyces sp. MS2A]|nr:hypothetical protein [Streptomyces sp. MS2A]